MLLLAARRYFVTFADNVKDICREVVINLPESRTVDRVHFRFAQTSQLYRLSTLRCDVEIKKNFSFSLKLLSQLFELGFPNYFLLGLGSFHNF